jgi:hypothetical protein
LTPCTTTFSTRKSIAGQPVVEDPPDPGDPGRDVLAEAVEHRRRAGHAGARPDRVEAVLLAVDPVAHGAVQAAPGDPDQLLLLAEIRHDPLGRVGWRRRPQIGHVVHQRRIRFVADRRDDRRTAGEDGPAERLVGEGQEVLERAAAAGQDDHVHRGVAVEHPQRVEDLRDRVDALHRHVLDPEVDGRPAAARVGQHIPLGGARPAGDETDAVGQERRPALAPRIEQSLGLQQLAEPLDAGLQLALAHLPDFIRSQGQCPPCGVPLRFGMDDHAGAVGEVRIDHVAGRRDGQAEVGRGVAEREKHRARTRSAGDLGDLAVDPQPPQTTDPLAYVVAHLAHRPRFLRTARHEAQTKLGR